MSDRIAKSLLDLMLVLVFTILASNSSGEAATTSEILDKTLSELEFAGRESPVPAFVIPPVLDRPEDDDGPRITVQELRLIANRNPQSAWRQGRYLASVEAKLKAALAAGPSGGFTISQLERLTQEIQSDLRSDGLIFAQVFLPVQQVVDGVLSVQIMEGRIGRVLVDGNQNYSEARLVSPVRSLVGRPVDNAEVESSLLLLRDYPGLVVSSVFSAGQGQGEADLTLVVHDERRAQFSLSADNYGAEFTGVNRVIASVDWYNPMGDADRLSLSLVQNFSPSDAVYGSLDYSRPMLSSATIIGAKYLLNAFDISSQLLVGHDEQFLEGKTTIGSLYVSHWLVRSRSANLRARMNLDSKRAVLDDVGGASQSFRLAEDRLTTLGFSMSFDWIDSRFRGVNRGYVDFSHGFPGVLGSVGRRSKTLGTSRRNIDGEFAGGQFDRWRAAFSRLQSLTENSDLYLRLQAQHSDDLIVSLEQFALGGPNSVRAYPPSEFLVDTGGFASLEWSVSAPGFATVEAFANYRWGDLLRISLFYDYAGGYLSEPAFGEQKTTDIHGYGLGIDFTWPGLLWARLDIATPVSNLNASDGDDPHVYLRFNYTF